MLPDGGAEQDPDDWWTAITTAAKRLIARQLVATDDITAICCTAQWSGTVAVDKQGQHLMNAIIWMDSRGANLTKKMVSGLINIEGYELFKIIRWLL